MLPTFLLISPSSFKVFVLKFVGLFLLFVMQLEYFFYTLYIVLCLCKTTFSSLNLESSETSQLTDEALN